MFGTVLESATVRPWVAAIVVVVFFVIAPRWTSTPTSRSADVRQVHTKPGEGDVPTLDGHELYYDQTTWPQYEARFNLRLSRLYGPVIRVELGPRSYLVRLLRWANACFYPEWRRSDTTVLINSVQDNEGALKRLLNACASRGPSIAAGKYLSRGQRIVLQPYGPEWTRHRKAFSLLLTKDKVKNKWAKALRFEALVMVDRMSRLADKTEGRNGAELVDEVSRFTASSVLQIAYARRAETPADPVLKELEIVSGNIASAFATGKYWVEDFPLLDVFPAFLSPWKRKLNADHEFESGLFKRLFRSVENRLEKEEGVGTDEEGLISAEECGAAQLLRKQEEHQVNPLGMAYLAAGLFEAGTETTAMSINTFLMAAACYPSIVREAQAEIDGLMGEKYGDTQAIPTFEDLERLPYLAAVVKETLRLTPTGSSGVGHTPTAAKPLSYELKGESRGGTKHLDVSPGATVLANIYGLHHDVRAFPDAWRFNPGRWISPSDPARISLDHTNATFAFGFGKRICPGGTLASYSMSMAIALLLLCFDFELTETAQTYCDELEKQNHEEATKWTALFSVRGREALQRERMFREHYEDGQDRIGKVLIDAHIAFKLSRSQVDECVGLRLRRGGHGIRAAQKILKGIQGQT